MPGRPPPHDPAPEPAAPEAALDAFRRALHPVLRAGDVDAFRRLVAASEDLLGDPADLADWPAARVRALMADLLREPGRFGLPRWPAVAPATPPATTAATSRTRAPEQAEDRAAGLGDSREAASGLRGADGSASINLAPPLPLELPPAATPPAPSPPSPPTAPRPRRRPRRTVPPEQLPLW